MQNDVYIKNAKIYSYDNSREFNPSEKYAEAINLSIKSDPKVYNAVRELLMSMNLDKKNIGTKEWNPFKDFIELNDCVLIKPNFVKHINEGPGDLNCLITNFSVIRPIIDYTILALNGTGKIIIGDAPVQECDFNQLKKIDGLEKNILKYKSIFKNIFLIDFRKNQNPDINCKLVDIGQDSEFYELDNKSKEYSITNYDLKLMNSHHINGKHEYIIPEDVLMADVIINIPKPKSHRKAGMTACMKNFVGINGNKECLPHHRTGDPSRNGDEFPERSIIKNAFSYFSKLSYLNNRFLEFVRWKIFKILKISKKDRFVEGSWYGNDTIWRTILDLNKLIIYADKQGKLSKQPQRKILNIADMIISGEKEGPLLPSNKEVGLLVAGFNQLNIDFVISQIMGFAPDKIKYIKQGYELNKRKISNSKVFKVFDDNGIVENIDIYNKHFSATDGWQDYLEGEK